MAIDPNWVAAIATAVGSAFAAGMYFSNRRNESRAGLPTLRLSALASATDPDALSDGWMCVLMEIIPGSDPHTITEVWADAVEVADVSWTTSDAGRRFATPGPARKRLKVEIYVDGVLASRSPERFWFAIRTSDMAVTIAAHIRLKSRFTKNKITTQIKIVR